jgi:hypothetical protein
MNLLLILKRNKQIKSDKQIIRAILNLISKNLSIYFHLC